MVEDNRELIDKELRKLPLGSIKPKGWLQRQLEIQAEGLSGYLDEIWGELKNNKWIGGEKEGWEKGPYYVDGLIPLGYLLENDRLINKCDRWIQAILESQRRNGWIGPVKGERHDRKKYDPWPNFIVLKVLKQYYEVTYDDKALEVMKRFCEYLYKNLNRRPLFEWGKYRWGEAVLSIHWLHDILEEDWLLKLTKLLKKQGYNWINHFRDFKYKDPQPINKASFETHVVNNAMGIKYPGIWYRQSGNEFHKNTLYNALENLDKFHGQVTGIFSGDEHFAGKSPSRGVELCAIVEFMFSLEKLIEIINDVSLADRLEKIAFNALPAIFKSDMCAHQYDQQINQVICNISEKNWSNSSDANIFGLEPNYGCCTANMHQGWPKLVSHLFKKIDSGLVAILYSPCEVRTTIDGKKVKVIEETNYPFEDKIEFKIDLEEPLFFKFKLRIPHWSQNAFIEINNNKNKVEPEPETFYEIKREWHSGDVVTVYFEPDIEVERRNCGSVSISRGPLIFSKSLKEKWKQVGGNKPYADWEVYPEEPWNLGINKKSLIEPEIQKKGKLNYDLIFTPQNAPIKIRVNGNYIDKWNLKNNKAGPIPNSPLKSVDVNKEEFDLIPYGFTNLRVTEFPLLVE